MQFGKVIGNIVATRKTGKTEGLRILIVQHLDEKLKPLPETYACIDTVNSKFGDIVLTCSSSSARMTSQTKGVCTDNSIIGVVDIVSSGKKDFYKK